MSLVEVHLVYDPGSHPALIGRTASPEALRVMRTILLDEAETRVKAMASAGNELLEASERADLERLRMILDALIPQ